MEFAYAGGGLGKGGKATLFVDGKKVGEGNIDATLAIVLSADDRLDVGEDSGAPVSPDYGPRGNAFNGEIRGVLLEIGEGAENADHLVKPEQALAVAMGRQDDLAQCSPKYEFIWSDKRWVTVTFDSRLAVEVGQLFAVED